MKKKYLAILLALGAAMFLFKVSALPAMEDVHADYSDVKGSRGMLSLPISDK